MGFPEPRTADNALWGGISSLSKRNQAVGMDFEGPGTVSHGLGVFSHGSLLISLRILLFSFIFLVFYKPFGPGPES